MKRRGPSNIVPVAPWMTRLAAKAPEGTHTPDQIATSLELVIAMGGDAAKVRSAIHRLALKAPLAHQPWVRKLDHKNDEQMLKQVRAFIDITNEKLALLQKEVLSDPEQEFRTEPGGESPGSSFGEQFERDWDDDGDIRRPRRSRGHRAVRAAKRGQADA